VAADCDRVNIISAKVGGNVCSTAGRSCPLRSIHRSIGSRDPRDQARSRVYGLARRRERRRQSNASLAASDRRSGGRQVRAEASVFGINVLPTTKQELFPLGSLPFVTVCGTLCVSAGLRASVQGEHTERALAASPSLPPPLSPLPPLSLYIPRFRIWAQGRTCSGYVHADFLSSPHVPPDPGWHGRACLTPHRMMRPNLVSVRFPNSIPVNVKSASPRAASPPRRNFSLNERRGRKEGRRGGEE